MFYSRRRSIIVLLLAIFYSTCMIVGTSFMLTGGFIWIKIHPLLSASLFVTLLFLFYFLLNKIFTILEKSRLHFPKFKKLKTTKLYSWFTQRTFLFSFIFLIACWLPYIIAFYPASLSPDPSSQIEQFLGFPNKYSEFVVMLDPNVTITNHHPVLHTLILGTCVKLGLIVNNVNLGLFLYSLIQITILATTLAYSLKFLKNQKLPDSYLIITLLVYGFVPIFPFYAMSPVKDVIFTCLIILYIITLYRLTKIRDLKLNNCAPILFLLILITFFRNNGIHVIVLSFPLLLFIKNHIQYRLKILGIFLACLVLCFLHNSFVLPYFRVTQTSIREALSVPFQQTARYVKYHGEEITEAEQQVIDQILGYETLAERYSPEFADTVKNEYNRYATKEDLKRYFAVWFSELKKHPKTYLEATIENTYGYFYPIKTSWYFYGNNYDQIVNDGLDYHFNNLADLRLLLICIGLVFPYLIGPNIFVNIGLNVWFIVFMIVYLFYQKKYRSIIYLTPSLALILVCFASPVNTYFRYALPYVAALCLNFGIFLKEASAATSSR